MLLFFTLGISCGKVNKHDPGYCVADEDCVSYYNADPAIEDYGCLSLVGACDVDNTQCRPAWELTVTTGCFLEVRNNPTDSGAWRCFIHGDSYPLQDVPRYACLRCDQAHPHYWTPGFIGDEESCFIDGATEPQAPSEADPESLGDFAWESGRCVAKADLSGDANAIPHPESFVASRGCLTCLPDDHAGRFRWSPIPTPSEVHEDRLECADPHFAVPDAQGSLVDSRTPMHSGSVNGHCWEGVCRGVAWYPANPYGWSALVCGTAAQPERCQVEMGGQTMVLHARFGGGFGASWPPPHQ